MNGAKRIPVCTYGLIILNILAFLFTLFDGSGGSTVLREGALYTPLVIAQGQWYRIFTGMFLHFSAQHLGSNMISLFAIGSYVELYYGKIRYLFLYILSGLGGNLLVMALELRTGNFALSAGASGCVFGLLGVLIVFAKTPVLRRMFPMNRVAAAVFFSLLPGFTDKSISLTAHVGGLITGTLTAFLFNLIKRKRNDYSNVSDR